MVKKFYKFSFVNDSSRVMQGSRVVVAQIAILRVGVLHCLPSTEVNQ